ncbi:hypothetical protein MRY87_01670 [bacterium]|nr:hypothetical protein [bacterium]
MAQPTFVTQDFLYDVPNPVHVWDDLGNSTHVFNYPVGTYIRQNDIVSDRKYVYAVVGGGPNGPAHGIYKDQHLWIPQPSGARFGGIAVDHEFVYTLKQGSFGRIAFMAFDKNSGVGAELWSMRGPSGPSGRYGSIVDLVVHQGVSYFTYLLYDDPIRDLMLYEDTNHVFTISNVRPSAGGLALTLAGELYIVYKDFLSRFPEDIFIVDRNLNVIQRNRGSSCQIGGSDGYFLDYDFINEKFITKSNSKSGHSYFKGCDPILNPLYTFSLSVLPPVEDTCSSSLSLPYGGRFRRVDFHGIPVPERSPTDRSESDRPESQLYVDSYSLEPHLNISDVQLPIEGDDLLLEFRRTAGVTSTRESAAREYQPITYPSDRVLGPGWRSNLGTRAIRSYDRCTDKTFITVTDEEGVSYRYEDDGSVGIGNSFAPDTFFSLNNQAEKADLYRLDDRTIVLEKTFGTKLTFEKLSTNYPPSGGSAYFEEYYRLISTEDRNGNRLLRRYHRDQPGNRQSYHVREIYEEAHPERKLTFQYRNGTGGNGGDWGDRLVSVTDPLGRVTTYEYGDSNGYQLGFLTSVTRESVQNGERAPPRVEAPVTQYDYYLSALPTEQAQDPTTPPATDPQVVNLFAAVSSITDPRGHVTDLVYVEEYFPSQIGGRDFLHTYQKKPRLASLSTADGTVHFALPTATHTSLTSEVTDTQGNLTTYTFIGAVEPADNSIRAMLNITDLSRTSPIGTVSYRWSNDAFSHLEQVTDLNGHTVHFEYTTPRSQKSSQPTKETQIDTITGSSIVRTFSYGAFHRLTSVTDGEGKQTGYLLDQKGNRRQIQEELQKTTIQNFTADGFLGQVTDPDGRNTSYSRSFSSSNLQNYLRVVETVRGYGNELGLTTTRTYDVMGNLVHETDPRGFHYSFGFDALYRQTSRTEPLSGTATVAYTLNGDPALESDFNGNVTLRRYDSLNRVIEERRRMRSASGNSGDDIVTRYTYTPAGFKRTATDPMGSITRYRYDSGHRLTSVTADQGGLNLTERYQYGTNSGSGAFSSLEGWSPTRVTNRRGYHTDTFYDGFYRPVRTIERFSPSTGYSALPQPNEPTTDYFYNRTHNEIAKVIRAENPAGGDRVLFTLYDELHRKIGTVLDIDGDLNDGALYGGSTGITSLSLGFTGDGEDQVSVFRYDLNGNITGSSDPEGNITRTTFDGANRPTVIRQPAVAAGTPTIRKRYDQNGNVTRITDPNGNVTQIIYDARNRELIRTVDMDGDNVFRLGYGPGFTDISTARLYDRMDNLWYRIDSNGNITVHEYDRAYRETRRVDAAVPVLDPNDPDLKVHPVTITKYDRNSNTLEEIDPNGIVTQYGYDALNRMLVHSRAVGTPVQQLTFFAYDENDNRTSATFDNSPFGGQNSTFHYDPFDRLILESWPAGAASVDTVRSYYRNDLLKNKVDPKGQTEEYEYDTAGRKNLVTFRRSDSSIEETRTFAYDRANNITSVSDAGGTSTLRYDGLYRLTDETRNDRIARPYTVTHEYDLNGNRAATIYPLTRRRVERDYDRLNRQVRVYDTGLDPGLSTDDQTTVFRYDGNGNVIFTSQPNGVRTTSVYDALNRLTVRSSRWSIGSGGRGPVYETLFLYDLTENRIGMFESLNGAAPELTLFDYDEQYRLITETRPGLSRFFFYDLAGNRLFSIENGQVTGHEYNERNELISLYSGYIRTPRSLIKRFTYDENGNLTRREDLTGATPDTNYTWDTNNRLLSVEKGGNEVLRAEYDYRNRRIRKREGGRETYFVYSEGLSLQEQEGIFPTVDYIRGNDLGGGNSAIVYTARYTPMDPQSNTVDPWDLLEEDEYFCPDHIGNTVALTDTAGSVTSTEQFDAFGVTRASTGSTPNTRRAFTKERDESTNLDYHGFRYYDPALGRYINRDPANFADGFNVYLYAKNNPVNRFDPQGLFVGFLVDALSVTYDTYQVVTRQITPAEYGTAMALTAASLAANTSSFGTAGLGIRAAAYAVKGSKAAAKIRTAAKAAANTGKALTKPALTAAKKLGTGVKAQLQKAGNFIARGRGASKTAKGTVAKNLDGGVETFDTVFKRRIDAEFDKLPEDLYVYTSQKVGKLIEKGEKIGRPTDVNYLTTRGDLSPLQAGIELGLPQANTAEKLFKVGKSSLDRDKVVNVRRLTGNVYKRGGGGVEVMYDAIIGKGSFLPVRR